LVNNPKQWEAVEEYLKHLKNLELQVLAVATSELEIYRSQGRVSSLERLLQLPQSVKQIIKEEQ
jgi:hypothetical protein